MERLHEIRAMVKKIFVNNNIHDRNLVIDIEEIFLKLLKGNSEQADRSIVTTMLCHTAMGKVVKPVPMIWRDGSYLPASDQVVTHHHTADGFGNSKIFNTIIQNIQDQHVQNILDNSVLGPHIITRHISQYTHRDMTWLTSILSSFLQMNGKWCIVCDDFYRFDKRRFPRVVPIRIQHDFVSLDYFFRRTLKHRIKRNNIKNSASEKVKKIIPMIEDDPRNQWY